MKDLEKIKEHITAIIRKEERKTQSEMEELSRKQHDSMGLYGVGGPYQRYERATCRGGILKPWHAPSAAAEYTGTASIQNGAYRRTAGSPVHANITYERTRRII